MQHRIAIQCKKVVHCNHCGYDFNAMRYIEVQPCGHILYISAHGWQFGQWSIWYSGPHRIYSGPHIKSGLFSQLGCAMVNAIFEYILVYCFKSPPIY